MSREKMLQAEIALKDEQLADLTKEIERLRRQLEESENPAKIIEANEAKIAELKQTINKLTPAAKKAVLYAAELQKTRRRLAVVERERNELSENYAATRGQAAALKSALTRAQKDVRALDDGRKRASERAQSAVRAAKTSARKNLVMNFATAVLCAFAIGGSYLYVRAALVPPAELSAEAAVAFKQHAAEYRFVVERAAQNERDALNAECERLAAERSRYEEWNENTVWDKIVSYGWLALIFGVGFVIGVLTVVAAFVFRMR